jgi:hypothetical protein
MNDRSDRASILRPPTPTLPCALGKAKFFLAAVLFVFATSSFAEAAGGYLPLWEKRPPNITDLALIYQGSAQRPQWTRQRYAPYVSYRDPRDGQEQWLFDGFLFIEFEDGRGHAFQARPHVRPAQKAHWLALLEKNFAPDDGIPNLERICRDTAARIGPPPRRRQIIITLPEASNSQTNWGEINGRPLDFRKTADRLAATDWYLNLVLQKWKKFAPQQLNLAGFYWGYESAPIDQFVKEAAQLVHTHGKQFFWIPYWHLPPVKGKQANWHSLGFDAAWQQPNHFFHPEIPDTRLDEACAFAKEHGMGLEMECNGRMLDKPKDFERRFDVYLDAFMQHGVKDASSIAYYEDGGTLFRLANSHESQMRAHYDRIAQFIVDRQKLADERRRQSH